MCFDLSFSPSLAALAISVCSFYFSIKSWRESHRPIICVRVTTNKSGNVGAALDLRVENTGNRPAKNIQLKADKKGFEAALTNAKERGEVRRAIDDCFDVTISVLEDGKAITNGFGFLTDVERNSDWKVGSKFNIWVTYQDIDGRRFKHQFSLILTIDQGFAGGFWDTKK